MKVEGAVLINLSSWNMSTVSVLHQDEGGVVKSIPDAPKISRDPRDFPREISRVEGNLEGGGDGFPNTSRVLVEYGHSLIINLSTGSGSENPSLDREGLTVLKSILPCWWWKNGRNMNTSKIKTSLVGFLWKSKVIYEGDDPNLDSNAFHGQMDRTLFTLV